MVTRCKQAGNTWLCAHLPLLGYQEAWNLQVDLVAAKKSGALPEDVLLLLEHPPVLTLGRQGGREHLKVSEGFLEECGLPLFQVERGGNITFHGPGQLVGYPIVDLRAAPWGVAGYVERLEEVMLRTAAHWGVHAGRNPLNHGIWIGGRKLGSIGIAVRGGIAFHGFAFNINVSLQPFDWINPCGLPGVAVTSLERELSRRLPMCEVRGRLQDQIEMVFGVKLAPIEPAVLSRLLRASTREQKLSSP
jgi:lipoyl(octanoyl) transferase